MVSLRSSCPDLRLLPPPLPGGAALELISKTSKGISNSGEEEEEEASSLPLGGAREGGERVVEEAGTERIERFDFDWTTRGTNMPLESEFENSKIFVRKIFPVILFCFFLGD